MLFFPIFGLCCTLFMGSYWPCIKFVVDKSLTTTAYGICFCIQDIFGFFMPLIIGQIIDHTKNIMGGYYWVFLY